MSFALYRHFDAAGVLLYVGVSADPRRRLWEHKCRSDWAHRVHSTTTETFERRVDALREERRAVATEAPAFNAQKNPRCPDEPRAADGSLDADAVISLWPSINDFAADLREQVGTVYVWRHRKRVPDRAVGRVFAAARKRGFAVDLDESGRIVASASTESAA